MPPRPIPPTSLLCIFSFLFLYFLFYFLIYLSCVFLYPFFFFIYFILFLIKADTTKANATKAKPHFSDSNKAHNLFIKLALNGQKDFNVVCRKPTIYAKLAMIIGIDIGKITYALPYIGVSKLFYIICNFYILAFNEVIM